MVQPSDQDPQLLEYQSASVRDEVNDPTLRSLVAPLILVAGLVIGPPIALLLFRLAVASIVGR